MTLPLWVTNQWFIFNHISSLLSPNWYLGETGHHSPDISFTQKKQKFRHTTHTKILVQAWVVRQVPCSWWLGCVRPFSAPRAFAWGRCITSTGSLFCKHLMKYYYKKLYLMSVYSCNGIITDLQIRQGRLSRTTAIYDPYMFFWSWGEAQANSF